MRVASFYFFFFFFCIASLTSELVICHFFINNALSLKISMYILRVNSEFSTLHSEFIRTNAEFSKPARVVTVAELTL